MIKKLINKIKDLGLKSILMMNLGLLSCAIATVLFITPSKIVIGGATGLAVFLQMLTAVDYYLFLYGINIILIIISFFTLGKEFTVKTIYGSIMLPTFGLLVSKLFVLCNINVEEIILGIEPVLVVISAAILMGFGIGINMKNGGSTGGFDILEALALKYLHISYSTSIYALDTILVVLGMIYYDTSAPDLLFKNALSEGLAAIMYIVIIGIVVDTITFGGYNKRAVFIRSSKYEEIHDAILLKLARGLTYVDAQGGYSLTSTKMIICICYSKEYFVLRELVQEIDPNAFVFATKATEVRGLGFNYETKEYIQARKKRRENKNDLSK